MLENNTSFLVADVEGSTKLISDEDVEQAREWLEGAVEIMLNAVQRYHGIVLSIAGDGVSAYFDGPEHNLRACCAAVKIQQDARQSKLPTAIRVGLHSAQSGKNQTPHLRITQFIEEQAPPQGIQLSEPMQKDCGPWIHAKISLSITPAGPSEPINTYTLQSVQSEVYPRVEKALDTLKKQGPAEKMIPSKHHRPGERKFITSVFIKTIPHNPQQTDFKAINEIIDNTVQRFEGILIKHIGDTILALFGAPITYEDHPLRACLASYVMQENMITQALPFDLKIGIHSGEAVIDEFGSQEYHQYDAVGSSVHLAARMMQSAEKHQIQLSEDTFRLVEPFIQASFLGEKKVKGFEHPIPCYTLTGLHPANIRKKLDAQFYGDTPFIGRENEMDLFKLCIEQTQNDHGTLLACSAEPGIGKTRLIYECSQWARAKDRVVYSVSASAYEKNQGFSLLRSFAYELFNVDRLHPTSLQINQATLQLQRVSFSEPLAHFAMLNLLSVEITETAWLGLSPVLQQKILFKSLVEFLISEDAKKPIVLAFEDLHWCDPESLAFIQILSQHLSQSKILLLLDYRPEFELPEDLKQKGEEISLKPLNSENSEKFLAYLLPGDQSLIPLRQTILKTTEGNPFFIEQYIKDLKTKKIVTLQGEHYHLGAAVEFNELPQTVQSLITSRIDLLAQDKKLCLQQASCLGRVFPLSFLRYINGSEEAQLFNALQKLEEYGFIYRSGLFPEPEYTFKHAYIRDVAYQNMLGKTKQRYHAHLVEQVEAKHLTELKRFLSLLAQHAYLGHLWEKALRYYNQMMPSSATIDFPNSQYIMIGERAEECFASLGEKEKRAHFRDYARILFLYAQGLFVKHRFEEYMQIFTTMNEQSIEFEDMALQLYCRAIQLFESMSGHASDVYPIAMELLTAVDEVSKTLNDEMSKDLRLHVKLAVLHPLLALARYQEMESILAEMLDEHLPIDYVSHYTSTPAIMLALTFTLFSELAQADSEKAEEKIGLLENYINTSPPKTEVLIAAYWGRLAYYRYTGDFEYAYKISVQMIQDAIEIEHEFAITMMSTEQAFLSWYCGKAEESLALAQNLFANFKETGYAFFPIGATLLIETLACCGAIEDAKAMLKDILKLSENDHLKVMLASCYRLQAFIDNLSAKDSTQDESILAHLEKAEALTQEMGCKQENPKIQLVYVEFYTRLGETEKAKAHHQRALDYFKEYGMIGWYNYYQLNP